MTLRLTRRAWIRTMVYFSFLPTGATACFSSKRLEIVRANLFLKELPKEADGLKIGVMSDFHAGAFNNEQSILNSIATINAEKPDLVILPKTAAVEQVRLAEDILGKEQQIIPLIESPMGLINLNTIAPSSSSIAMVMFGGVDFTLEIQAKMTWDSLLVARSQMVITAAAYGLRVIDVPFLDVNDITGLEETKEK